MPSEADDLKARRAIVRILNNPNNGLIHPDDAKVDIGELFVWELLKIGYNVGVRDAQRDMNNTASALILEEN